MQSTYNRKHRVLAFFSKFLQQDSIYSKFIRQNSSRFVRQKCKICIELFIINSQQVNDTLSTVSLKHDLVKYPSFSGGRVKRIPYFLVRINQKKRMSLHKVSSSKGAHGSYVKADAAAELLFVKDLKFDLISKFHLKIIQWKQFLS